MSQRRSARRTISTYNLLVGIVTITVALATASSVEAAANCWCKVQCGFPNASAFEDQKSWAKRPNGKNFNYPHSSKEWSECKEYCREYVHGLALQEMAKERKSCGTVECTSRYWLGARPKRGGDPRIVPIECNSQGTGSQSTDFQYAVKFICGPADQGRFVHPGDYATTVNAHNPAGTSAETRHKVALGERNKDGLISGFVLSDIGSDGVQYYDCRYLRSLAATPGLLDGFFVIESHSELDVAAYYTSSDVQQVNAIHVEKYPGRQVPGKNFLCQENFRVNLATPQNWATTTGTAVTVAPLPGAWDPGRTWMSYTTNGHGVPSSTSYQLDFCCCPGGTVTVAGDAKSDNTSIGTLMPGSTNLFTDTTDFTWLPTRPAMPFRESRACAGPGAFNVAVTDGGNPSGLSLTGTLILSSGYLGKCKAP